MILSEFIRNVLAAEVGDIVERHKYLSFSIISQGIEFLGACLDEFDFDLQNNSGQRFDNALLELFPSTYKIFADRKKDISLYKNIRCGLIHYGIPKKKFVLGSIMNGDNEDIHLKSIKCKDGSKRYGLIAEIFYKDFRNACRTLAEIIDNGDILKKPRIIQANHDKKEILSLEKEFLRTDL